MLLPSVHFGEDLLRIRIGRETSDLVLESPRLLPLGQKSPQLLLLGLPLRHSAPPMATLA